MQAHRNPAKPCTDAFVLAQPQSMELYNPVFVLWSSWMQYVCVCLLCLSRNLVSVGCEWLSTSTCHIHAVLCLARYFAYFHQDRWCFQTAVWKRIFSKAGWEGIWDVVDGWGGCKCWGLELFPDFEPKIASVRVWVLLLLAAQIVLLLLFPKWKQKRLVKC